MRPPFSAVLLAGGKSRRMGREKAFVKVGGRALWERQVEILRELGPAEIFIAGPARAEWAGFETLADALENAGPLAGLTAALARVRTPLLVALALDLPAMPAAYFRSLLDESLGDCGSVPHRAGRFEPLAAVYPAGSRVLAETHLRGGRFALQDFARACLAEELVSQKEVAPEEEAFFANVNTPADLAAFIASV